MNINEIDWRHSWTWRIFEALSEGVKKVKHDLDEVEESDEFYFDADRALEGVNAIFGIAFVSAQTYITGTVSDVNMIVKSGIKYKKEQLLKNHSDYMPGLSITKLEFCDAMANYFKHHDEWPDWSAPGAHKKTVTLLQAVGITENVDYICVKAMEALLQDNQWNLDPLLELVTTWRKSVIEEIKLM